MQIKKMAIVALSLIPLSAGAIVLGGTNLGVLGYPELECRKPYDKPRKPYSFNNQWEVDQYNREVTRYNDELQQYKHCVVEYLENAENDILRIREAMEEAVADARREY